MSRILVRLAVLGCFGLLVTGCASSPETFDAPRTALRYPGTQPVARSRDVGRIETPAHPMQCVSYARARSGIALHGDAQDWWDAAEGRYARNDSPVRGSVMALEVGSSGHVAVVRDIDSTREITVDHANWLNDGDIYLDDPVMDVSAGNDWSAVRVFNQRTGSWGVRTYRVQGFIGPAREGDMRVAERD